MFYAYKKIKQHRANKAAQAQAQKAAQEVGEQPIGNQQPVGNQVTDEPKKVEKKELSPEEIADKKRRTVYRWKLIAGLFGPFALQALDTTIIASALSDIATEFRKYTASLAVRR